MPHLYGHSLPERPTLTTEKEGGLMDASTILLIDLNSGSRAGYRLTEKIEGGMKLDMQLKHIQPEGNKNDTLIKKIRTAMRQTNPKIIFLVLSPTQLGKSSILLKTLAHQFKHIPLILAMDVYDPGVIFLLLNFKGEDAITPIFEKAHLWAYIDRVLKENYNSRDLKHKLKEKLGLNQLVGNSPAFRETTKKIPMVGKCDAGVLISGETGTGKEMCARAIHYLSPRSSNPFIAFNCGATPDDLIENELFGHVQGAYTGASSQQPGLIKEASGGTLFLDDIDCLPLSSQVKLLRFLQEKEYRQLGSARVHHADIRIIAATNTNLNKAVEDGQFRQDLYYRINIIPLTIPSLRERVEDIPLLAQHFVEKYAYEFNKEIEGITPEALKKLKLHNWPGNVRELEHTIERAVVFTEDSIIRDIDLLLPGKKTKRSIVSFKEAKAQVIKEFEENYIEKLLMSHQGNITKAARTAQKNRRAFWQLIRKHQIDVQMFRPG